MKCPNCNFNNADEKIFCVKCGQRIQGEEFIHNSNQVKFNASNNTTSADTVINSADINENFASEAWKDIKKSASWIKKLVIVGLCNIIPIVNFACSGYAQKWGLEAAKGKRLDMHEGLFDDNSFKTGFFEWVAWIAYGFVLALATSIINGLLGKLFLIGALLWIAIIVLEIFWNAYVSLACMKSCCEDKLGSSFKLKEIWTSYKTGFGKIVLSYFLPSLICKAIAIAFCFVIFGIFASSEITTIISLITNLNNSVISTSLLPKILSITSALALSVLLSYIGCAFMAGIEKMIRYRALGLYIYKFNNNWPA